MEVIDRWVIWWRGSTTVSREKEETGPTGGLSMALPWQDVIDAIMVSHVQTQSDKHARPLTGMVRVAIVP